MKSHVTGGHSLNSRKLVQMFFKTLFIGGIIGLVTSFFVMSAEYAAYLNPLEFKDLLGVTLFFLGYALVFTVVSQTGFFAYLFINQYGGALFKALWPTVQLLLVILVVASLIYVPPKEFISLSTYILLTLIIVIAGAAVAFVKFKQTNFTALIPALFLMIVMTVLEWTPVLRGGDFQYMLLVLPTLIGANAYQLIALHHVTKVDENHQKRQKERLKQREQKRKNKQNKNIKTN